MNPLSQPHSNAPLGSLESILNALSGGVPWAVLGVVLVVGLSFAIVALLSHLGR